MFGFFCLFWFFFLFYWLNTDEIVFISRNHLRGAPSWLSQKCTCLSISGSWVRAPRCVEITQIDTLKKKKKEKNVINCSISLADKLFHSSYNLADSLNALYTFGLFHTSWLGKYLEKSLRKLKNALSEEIAFYRGQDSETMGTHCVVWKSCLPWNKYVIQTHGLS